MGSLSPNSNKPKGADKLAPGQYEAGNLDLHNRPIVNNKDGSISTVRSITITGDGGKAVVIPTAINGKIVSDSEAVAHFKKTGENLGKFNNEQNAMKYAQNLHEQQAAEYLPKSKQTSKPSNLSKADFLNMVDQMKLQQNPPINTLGANG